MASTISSPRRLTSWRPRRRWAPTRIPPRTHRVAVCRRGASSIHDPTFFETGVDGEFDEWTHAAATGFPSPYFWAQWSSHSIPPLSISSGKRPVNRRLRSTIGRRSSRERTAVVLAVPRGPMSRIPPTEGLINPSRSASFISFWPTIARKGKGRLPLRLYLRFCGGQALARNRMQARKVRNGWAGSSSLVQTFRRKFRSDHGSIPSITMN